jgi:hypothetical protein
MPRLKKVPCAHCDAKIVQGNSFCTNCEQPTIWASSDERTTWELRQWQEKGTPRVKRAASKRTEATLIKAEAPAPLKPAPLVPHPASVKAGLVKAAPAPMKRIVALESAPSAAAPKMSAPKVSAPKVSAPKVAALKVSVPKVAAPKKKSAPKVAAPKKSAPKVAAPKKSAPKKQVAVSKPEPVYAAEKPMEAINKPAMREPVVARPATTIDLTDAPSTKSDPAMEQVELLRELLQRVISIEEKMGGNGAGRVRRLRLLKR